MPLLIIMQRLKQWLQIVNHQLYQIKDKLGYVRHPKPGTKYKEPETLKEMVKESAQDSFHNLITTEKYIVTAVCVSNAFVTSFIMYQFLHIADTGGWVSSDVAITKRLVNFTKGKLDSFVWYYDPIRKMLVDILCLQVFENQRMQFMLARSLNRVINMNIIERQLKTLTKENVLKESVLYSPEVYTAMKEQLIGQIKSDNFRDLVKNQIITFSKTDTAKSLTAEKLGNTLRLKPVVKSFVGGVVDSSIYGMLENKENARKLDNQLYEILK